MAHDPRKRVVSFQSGRARRDGERLRSVRTAFVRATEEQARAAERLEAALRELESASLAAERAAWALTVAERRRIQSVRFEVLMAWLADVCKVRNGGEHFCIAEIVRSTLGDAEAADVANGRD